MTTFVGMEYVIGNAFIHLTKKQFLTLEDLYNYCIQIQNYWNSNGINAVITREVKDAVYIFEDYFDFQKESDLITLKSSINKSILEQRFVGYLPLSILLSFQKVAEKVA